MSLLLLHTQLTVRTWVSKFVVLCNTFLFMSSWLIADFYDPFDT